MKMPPFTYHRPETVAETLALLAELGADAKILAGGQSLLPLMALRLSQPEHLVDIGRLTELDQIRSHEGGVAIGALIRHSQVEDSDLVANQAPLVAAAMNHIGHRAIRNRGTLVGSLAHADPAAEMPAVALAVGAEFVAATQGGERCIPASAFFDGYLTSALADDELLTEVRFPAWPVTTGGSLEEVSRRHGDYALVGVAATLDVLDGAIASAALAYFGASATPVRVTAAEASLVGTAPTIEAFAGAAEIVKAELDPPDDNHASAAYRSHVAGVLTKRALANAATKIGVEA